MLVIGGANASAARQNVSEIKGTVLDKATASLSDGLQSPL